MIQERNEQLDMLLKRIAELLEMPDALYEAAVNKYNEVGDHLGAEDSELLRFAPEIYPQGSFRLGTIIRPLTEKDEYDLDFVCRLLIAMENTTQQELKARVGDRLKERKDFKQLLEEGRRCWTLHFKERFHMDVLPAIPDSDGARESILITDKELRFWQHSHPIGYADWFWDRMRPQAERQLKFLAESLQKNIEDVPRWKVKTPLQRAVQLLKRHRDLYFQNDLMDKPVSIIITTLAAKSYDNNANLYDALVRIVREMPQHIEKRNGSYWVANPVNPRENFADKWQEHPERLRKFFAWLKKLDEDLTNVLETRGLPRVADILGLGLGRQVVEKALKATGTAFQQERASGNLQMTAGTGMLGASGEVKVKAHTFFGDANEGQNS